MKAVKEYLDNLDFDIDISNLYNEDMTFGDLEEEIITAIFQEDIIYYYNAIKYLQDNDPSLFDSITLAEDAGFELASLNSEVLASLLYQDKLRTEYYNTIEQDLRELFDKL